MERKEQSAMKTLKQFYFEKFLSFEQEKPKPISLEERIIKIIVNILNIYNGLKHLRKIDQTNDDNYVYIMKSLIPVMRLLKTGVRNKTYNVIDFSGKTKEEIINILKGIAGSVNLITQTLQDLYSNQTESKTLQIINRVSDKFSTPHILIERLK